MSRKEKFGPLKGFAGRPTQDAVEGFSSQEDLTFILWYKRATHHGTQRIHMGGKQGYNFSDRGGSETS